MSQLVNAAQRANQQKTLAYLDSLQDPRVAGDALLKEIGELALIQNAMKGRRDFVSGSDTFEYKDPNKAPRQQQFAMTEADPVEMSERDLLSLEIAEAKNAIENKVDIPEAQSPFSETESRMVGDIFRRNLRQGDLNMYGKEGTANRKYGPEFGELAGSTIPVNMSPEQVTDRSVKLYVDIAGGVDPDTGAGLYGVNLDAMHRNPAAHYPDQVATVDNIKFGPRHMNRGDGDAEGEALRDRRKSRLVNLQAKRFAMENDDSGVPPTTKMVGSTVVPLDASPELTQKLLDADKRDRAEAKLARQVLKENPTLASELNTLVFG